MDGEVWLVKYFVIVVYWGVIGDCDFSLVILFVFGDWLFFWFLVVCFICVLLERLLVLEGVEIMLLLGCLVLLRLVILIKV